MKLMTGTASFMTKSDSCTMPNSEKTSCLKMARKLHTAYATKVLTCLLLLTLAILSRLLANLTGTTRDKATDSFDLKSTGHGRGRKEHHPGKASTKGRHLGYDFPTSSVFHISMVPPVTSNDILTCNKAVPLATALLLHEKFYIRYLH